MPAKSRFGSHYFFLSISLPFFSFRGIGLDIWKRVFVPRCRNFFFMPNIQGSLFATKIQTILCLCQRYKKLACGKYIKNLCLCERYKKVCIKDIRKSFFVQEIQQCIFICTKDVRSIVFVPRIQESLCFRHGQRRAFWMYSYICIHYKHECIKYL